jgi:ABC-2 type transport system permease protein
MFVELIVYSFNGQNMATEIRLGRISSFLLYPISFNFYQFGKFLGVIIIQIMIAILSVALFYAIGMIHDINITGFILGIIFCFLSATIWYLINYISGVMAFWMEETWFLRVTVTLICRLIGGAIMPLEFFPDWLRFITYFTPFTYMIFYPIKILEGDFSNITSVFIVLLAWCGVFTFCASKLWKMGVRSYTAAGA